MIYRRLEQLFAVLGLFYMTGAAVAMLTPRGGTADGAPLYRLLGLLVGLISIVLISRVPDIIDRVIRNYWPVLLLTALILTSGFWSANPDLAFRRSGALAFTVIFAIYLTERYDERSIFSLLLATAVATCAGCYVAIFAFPTFGVHQGGEPIPGFWQLFNDNDVVHAGSWRGLYDHKNDLGRFAALSGMFFLVALMTGQRARLLYLAALAFAGVLIANSRSSQAILLLLVPGGVLVVATWLRALTPARRAMGLALLAPFIVAALVSWNLIFDGILGMLGKDQSLTGRTEIWSLVLEGMQGRYLFGGGYGTGMILLQPLLEGRMGNTIGHAHNGYLALMVDVGFVGLGIALAIFAGVVVGAVLRLFSTRASELALLGIGFCVFTLFGNIVGSFLFDYNSLYTVMLVMMWGLLRRRSAVSRLRIDRPVLIRDSSVS